MFRNYQSLNWQFLVGKIDFQMDRLISDLLLLAASADCNNNKIDFLIFQRMNWILPRNNHVGQKCERFSIFYDQRRPVEVHGQMCQSSQLIRSQQWQIKSWCQTKQDCIGCRKLFVNFSWKPKLGINFTKNLSFYQGWRTLSRSTLWRLFSGLDLWRSVE